jgi:hypothetical protein
VSGGDVATVTVGGSVIDHGSPDRKEKIIDFPVRYQTQIYN